MLNGNHDCSKELTANGVWMFADEIRFYTLFRSLTISATCQSPRIASADT
jgi:hypothetical protein